MKAYCADVKHAKEICISKPTPFLGVPLCADVQKVTFASSVLNGVEAWSKIGIFNNRAKLRCKALLYPSIATTEQRLQAAPELASPTAPNGKKSTTASSNHCNSFQMFEVHLCVCTIRTPSSQTKSTHSCSMPIIQSPPGGPRPRHAFRSLQRRPSLDRRQSQQRPSPSSWR